MGCVPAALGVRARRERQRAKQTLHAVKLRGGDDFLYDVATAKSASTETSSVGSSAPRERRPFATELVSVENRLDAAGIPHTSLSHALPRHRACLGGKPFRRSRNPSRVPRTRPPSPPSLSRWGREGSRVAGGGSCRIIRPSEPDPCVGWRQRLVRFSGCQMHARCAHVSKRTTGALRMRGRTPFWVAAEGRVRDLMGRKSLHLSQVFASRTTHRLWTGCRRTRMSVVHRTPNTAIPTAAIARDPTVGWRWNLVRFSRGNMRAPCAHVFPEPLRRKPFSLQSPSSWFVSYFNGVL